MEKSLGGHVVMARALLLRTVIGQVRSLAGPGPPRHLIRYFALFYRGGETVRPIRARS